MIAMVTNVNGKIYKTADAAKYLGLAADTIRKYVQNKQLTPLMTVGQNYVFSKEELDRYRKEKRPVGRPKPHSA
jgi:excisionase family DNA binding protein